MITKVKITDVNEAIELTGTYGHEFDTVVSLYDPQFVGELDVIKEFNKNRTNFRHHIEEFCDIDEQWITKGGHKEGLRKDEYEKWLEHPYHNDMKGPCFKNVLALVQLARELQEDNIEHNILIHCHAGVSRSTATAILFAYMRDKDEAKAILSTHHLRYCMWPNQLLLRIADDILETSKLYPTVKEWKRLEETKPFGFSL